MSQHTIWPVQRGSSAVPVNAPSKRSSHVSMFGLRERKNLRQHDTMLERLRTGTHTQKKPALAPADEVRYGGIAQVALEIRAASRATRLRGVIAAEQAAGIYYCRICEEECTNGCCPTHGRQYGVR